MYYHITHLPPIPPMPEDYNPWLTGIASYFDGVFNLDDCKVIITTGLPSIWIEFSREDSENGDGRYFQGAEPDVLIKNMCWRWENSNETRPECVSFILTHFI